MNAARAQPKGNSANQTGRIAPEGRDNRKPKTHPSELHRSRVTAEGRSAFKSSRGQRSRESDG
eukprot:4423675-Pyramimonas_sp.AAC.1